MRESFEYRDSGQGTTDASTPPAGASKVGAETSADAGSALLPQEETDRLWSEWESVQTRFVDDPRGAVENADRLVEKVMGRISETFETSRSELESQWSRGEDSTTEELRVALQRYRSFFDRLLLTSRSG
jgi:hypothetical protein